MGRPSAVNVGLVAIATTAASLTPSAPPTLPTSSEIRNIVAQDDSRPTGPADNGDRGTGSNGLPGPDAPPAGYPRSPDRPYSTPDINPLYPMSTPIPGGGTTAGSASLGIPGIVLTAYQNAASNLALADPTCQITWQMIAGIGKVESNHAWGAVASNGDTSQRILGPVLNGSRWAAISDTDNGALDGNSSWDRAVGPMQFIPSSWQIYASDGNADGLSNPHNVFDASVATAKYLCNGSRTLGLRSDLIAAIYSYNHSNSYVRRVLGWIDGYTSGGARPIDGSGPAPGPWLASPDPTPEPPDPDPSDPAPDPEPSTTPKPKPPPTEPSPDPAPTLIPSSPEPSPTPSTPKPRPTTSSTPKPTASPTPTSSPSPSQSPSPSPSPTPSDSPSPSPTPEPSESPSPEPNESPTPAPTCSPAPTTPPTTPPTSDGTDTPSPSPSGEVAPSPVATATGAAVQSASLVPTEDEPTPSPTPTCLPVP
ncbi:lytic transglycosylase domain-containing protein [Tenggerimyces flavus]|uniref:Lytic transglycosylase domain-containing protein n=1 Tax=Tenggerimyces flavus TaxID=1708749 RepID=A0ABV7YA07_9ACTN|nr:lytic transglycosylase domain-containing protein [Tenggerimyces flavus]MBM7789012.1 hypothetical protein [Tenggerimyces flavus]